MGLLPSRYTPRLVEHMVRLGSKLPFRQAQGEIERFSGLHIGVTTVQRQTQQYGAACEAVTAAEVAALEKEGVESGQDGPKLVVSADGCFVALTTGEWREVKTVAVGEYEAAWDKQQGQMTVQTRALSTFSRTYGAREFERQALAELTRRGLAQARQVVAVNDGASWIQSFIDYHAPEAIRILDFAHAAGYIAKLGKAVLGEDNPQFPRWFQQQCHNLKHRPAYRNLADLAWFGQQASTLEQQTTVASTLHYLQQRATMIDYPHFRLRGFPIGSGSVESSHKQVVQSRMKQAGMRWADPHLNGFLALRNLVVNDRWDEGWLAAATFYRQQRRPTQVQEASPVTPPLTFADVLVADDCDAPPSIPATSSRPQNGAWHKSWHKFRLGPPSKWARYRTQRTDS